jgi:hypothetical protein
VVLYRFLFAPVLLAVAVLSGARTRPPARDPRPAAVRASGEASAHAPASMGGVQGPARAARAAGAHAGAHAAQVR